jgi:hypothetical protein
MVVTMAVFLRKFIVGEDSQHVVECRIRLFQESHEYATQNVLHAYRERIFTIGKPEHPKSIFEC